MLAIMVATMTACSSREELSGAVRLPLTVSLPADNHFNGAQAPSRRRIMGDPGTYETFQLPKHLYFVVMRYSAGDWSVWYATHERPEASDWTPTRYDGALRTASDSIYQYNKEINLLLQSESTFKGRVYAIASEKELRFNDGKTFEQLSLGTMNLDDLLALTFSTAPDSIQTGLQNIYTSPYNYMVSDKYYGEFNKLSADMIVQYVNLMLYHVAAKVDIKWNVATDKRIDLETPSNGVRLTYLEARRLFNGYAYCFCPMRNHVASLPASGYDIPDIVTPDDEGLWWEGRTYFYTIPYVVDGNENYFPLQLLMRTNGSAGTGYQLTLNQPVDTSDIFVPWIRGNFNFSQPLTDRTETKTIGE